MKRSNFIKAITLLPIYSTAMKLQQLQSFAEQFKPTEKMPVLFFGHGSPMNAIEDNDFVTGWKLIGKMIPKPNAIICVSAHWETKGTFVTAMDKPRTIHDFGGFPQALFDVQYPAPGNPVLAQETQSLIKETTVGLDQNWGLDHGAWSVIKRLYPAADIPVLQLSLDYTKAPGYHYRLAKELAVLRERGILIIGSGNIIHNLGMVAWNKLNEKGYGYDWAIEAHAIFNKLILSGDHAALFNYSALGKSVALSIPTPEHYLPLLYILALKGDNEKIELFNDELLGGSLSMTSLKISA